MTEPTTEQKQPVVMDFSRDFKKPSSEVMDFSDQFKHPHPVSDKTTKSAVDSINTVSGILTAGLVAANWIYPLYHIGKLPETLPLSYSLSGAINWSGNKYLLLSLPIGATIAYLRDYFFPRSTAQALFPLRVPQANPVKISRLANTLNRALGIITQVSVLAGAVLLVKGLEAAPKTRQSWILSGVITGVLAIVFSYAGVHHSLNDNKP